MAWPTGSTWMFHDVDEQETSDPVNSGSTELCVCRGGALEQHPGTDTQDPRKVCFSGTVLKTSNHRCLKFTLSLTSTNQLGVSQHTLRPLGILVKDKDCGESPSKFKSRLSGSQRSKLFFLSRASVSPFE